MRHRRKLVSLAFDLELAGRRLFYWMTNFAAGFFVGNTDIGTAVGAVAGVVGIWLA